MTTDDISTLYGDEVAAALIQARIPFSVTYKIENQASFSISPVYVKHAQEMMSKIRRTKLR